MQNVNVSMGQFNNMMAAGQGMLWNALYGDGLAEQLQACGMKVPPKPDTAEKTSCLHRRSEARGLTAGDIARMLGRM